MSAFAMSQCFESGSGSGGIRIVWPDPDPIQESLDLIWILVAKENRDKLTYKSTKSIRI